MSSTCRSCRAPIRWTTTTEQKHLPIDPAPHVDGNVKLISTAGARQLRSVVLDRDEALMERMEGTPLYRAHFKSCTHAHLHRRRRT